MEGAEPSISAAAELLPGHHLYRGPDGSWRVAAPGDRFTRIHGPDDPLAAFQAVAHRPATEDSTAPLPPAAEQLVAAFARQGLLTSDPAVTTTRAPRVLLDGSGPVAELVAHLLISWAEVTHSPVDGGTIPPAVLADHDVLVSCAGWLPDAAWQRLDRACLNARTAWHRCHVEGTTLFVGPLGVGTGPSYRDLRGRRLAASTAPDELLALWRHLEDPDVPHPAVPWPGSGATAVAAGVLVDDLQRWWNSGRGPARSWEHEIGHDADTGALRVRAHPVLPLPVTAPTPTTPPARRTAE
jgi:hypothetical protein